MSRFTRLPMGWCPDLRSAPLVSPGLGVPMLFFFLAAAAAASGDVTYTFSRIANGDTNVPGSSSPFTGFDYLPAVSGNYVLFSGPRRMTGYGLYTSDGATLSRVADTTTPAPDGGTFSDFNGFSQDGAATVFTGLGSGGVAGVYRYSGGTTDVIANTHTSVLTTVGGSGGFNNFLIPSASAGHVAFNASTTDGYQGLFTNVRGTLLPVADHHASTPGLSGYIFDYFGPPTLRGTRVAFAADSDLPDGSVPLDTAVYVADAAGGGLTRIAALSRSGSFVGFDGTSVAFADGPASSPYPSRIRTTIGGALHDAIGPGTLIPGTATPFGYVSPNLSLDAQDIAFLGGTGPGNHPGDQPTLYLWDDGTIGRVLGPGDSLDGRTVSSVTLGPDSLREGRLAVSVGFTDSTQGIYVTTVPEPGAAAAAAGLCLALLRRRRVSGPIL